MYLMSTFCQHSASLSSLLAVPYRARITFSNCYRTHCGPYWKAKYTTISDNWTVFITERVSFTTLPKSAVRYQANSHSTTCNPNLPGTTHTEVGFLRQLLLPLLIHHFAYPLLPLSSTPGLKPTCFTNPTPVVSLLPPRLPSRTIARTVSSKQLGFCFSYSLFFVSVPCAGLSWLSRQLLSAR